MTRKLLGILPKRIALRELVGSLTVTRGFRFGQQLASTSNGPSSAATVRTSASVNPIGEYFDSHTEGLGIWKWRHYFELYQHHFQKFVGQPVNVLEIGIYGGGSLGMWKEYFGPQCRIFGIDIEPACKSYENESVRVFIGDQGNRDFWRSFRKQTPPLDIVIDDGGHQPEQQIVTLEETLPHLRPGGVYLCEDVGPTPSEFMRYVSGLVLHLHSTNELKSEPDNPERKIVSPATVFQSAIHSVHLYPFVVVIERREAPVKEFVAPKHGTEWLPFCDG